MTIDERKKQLQEHIDSIGSRTDYDNLRKIKNILNGVFGEECNQIVSPTSIQQFEEVIRRCDVLLERVYSTSDEEFTVIIENCVLYEVLIHFPTITITNTRGESTQIHDLYVSFHIRPDGRLKYTRIYGTRTTYSNQQYLSGYIHSHLRPLSSNYTTNPFAKFCLGTGPIKQTITLLIAGFDEINFNLFCLHLRNYISWESLEGTPHFSMDKIGTSSQTLKPMPNDLLEHLIYALMIIIIKTEGWTRNNLKFEFGRKEIKVSMTDQGERELAQFVMDSSEPLSRLLETTLGYDRYPATQILSYGICTKDYHNNYFSLPEGEVNDLPISPTPVLKFKGEDKFLKVTGVDKTIKTIKYGHPKITSGICRLFSEKFTKEIITSEGVTF